MNSIPEDSSSQGAPPAAQERVRRLREQIAELRKTWPPHSVPPSMVERLDELDEALESELRKMRGQTP